MAHWAEQWLLKNHPVSQNCLIAPLLPESLITKQFGNKRPTYIVRKVVLEHPFTSFAFDYTHSLEEKLLQWKDCAHIVSNAYRYSSNSGLDVAEICRQYDQNKPIFISFIRCLRQLRDQKDIDHCMFCSVIVPYIF